MIEIFGSILAVVAILLATRRRRRRRRPILAIPFHTELGVGALSPDTLTSTGATGITNHKDMYLISMDVAVAMQKNTAGDGPLEFGVAHGDYSDSEMEEWIEAIASWNDEDQVLQERRRRKCRKIGILPGLSTEEVWNNGVMKRVKLGFTLQEGLDMAVWCYNADDTARNTGAKLRFTGTIYARKI